MSGAPRPPVAPGDAAAAGAALVLPLVVLAMGHMLSNAVRTLPAIAVDVLARDLAVTPGTLASLTGAYHLAFAAGQVPLGVALDRFGVRPVSLTLLATVAGGGAAAAFAQGPWSFVLAQVVLGLGSSGMLLCPMTYAARILTPARFGLWSGLILGLGNTGMLLSASPLALLVEAAGWRAGYWASLGIALPVLALVFAVVRDAPPEPDPRRTVWSDAREVVALMGAPALLGIVALAFASFAAVIGVRGLWGGPWLMEVRGLTRLGAGHVLLAGTVALSIGPALAGMLDRRIGHRRALVAGGHFLAAAALGLLIAGGAAGLPPAWDAAMLVLFGLFISTQPLGFALTRAAVPPERTGRALSAVNLSFFAGAAALQAVSGPVAAWGGVGAGLGTFAAALAVCTSLFLLLERRR